MNAEDSLTLEATLPIVVADTFARHPAIASRRTGRGRGTAEERIWLDTQAGHLAARGLVVELRRDERRLMLARPSPDAPWFPATLAPPLRILARDEAPDEAGGEALLPIAAFSGRRLVLPLGDTRATVLRGALRGVTSGQDIARLILTGPAAATIVLALSLAAALPLLPPAFTLAEEGRALARGEAPRPIWRGPPAVDHAMSIDDALAHAIGHLIGAAIAQLPAVMRGGAPEGVHQLRVALRRLRSALRLFRGAADGPALRAFDADLRGVLDTLGPARDWDVWLSGLGAELATAMPEDERVARLIAAAGAERDAAYAKLRVLLDSAELRQLLWRGVALALQRDWRAPAPDDMPAATDAPLADFARAVLARRWKRLRRDLRGMEALDAEALHALRLDAKRMRYAAEVFAPLWPGRAARRFLKRLARLQDRLGIANDTAVARGLVRSLGASGAEWAGGAAEGWAAARLHNAREGALAAGAKLRTLTGFWDDDR